MKVKVVYTYDPASQSEHIMVNGRVIRDWDDDNGNSLELVERTLEAAMLEYETEIIRWLAEEC